MTELEFKEIKQRIFLQIDGIMDDLFKAQEILLETNKSLQKLCQDHLRIRDGESKP